MAIVDFTANNTPLQQLSNRQSNQLKRSNPNQRPAQKRTRVNLFGNLLVAIWELAIKFGKRTRIHGMDRLLGARSTKIERFFWLLTVLSAIVCAVYVCLVLSRRYRQTRFQTVIDSTDYPVYRIYFPAITICNRNRLNWQRLEEAKQRFLPGENSTEKLQIFERIIGAYDDISIKNLADFASLSNETLVELNHVNFSLVFKFMTWRCEEILTNCVWRRVKMNCCDIFSLRRCLQGLCLAFNTMENEEGRHMQKIDPYWPWRTSSAGPQSGLVVRVLLNPEKHYPLNKKEKGINVMITRPFTWHRDHPLILLSNTQNVIELKPLIFFYDNNTRSVPSEQRKCVFSDETESDNFKTLRGFDYSINNCKPQCQQEYLLRYCNCTMDLFFPPAQYPSCKTIDLPCLGKYQNKFLHPHQPGEDLFVSNTYKGIICQCYRSCVSLNYILDTRPTFLPMEKHGNISYIDLDVHFRSDTITVYRTTLVFSWLDLIVSFGGIAGLFLGCSLISGVELAYFLCMEVPAFTINSLKERWQRNRAKIEGLTLYKSRNRFNIQNQLEEHVLQMKQEKRLPTRFKAIENNWQLANVNK